MCVCVCFLLALQVLGPMHCPTALVANDKEMKYPLPEPSLPLNFTNSTGLRYEAEEVRQCLLRGRSSRDRGCAGVGAKDAATRRGRRSSAASRDERSHQDESP